MVLRSVGLIAYAVILTLVGSTISIVMPQIQPSYASHENITVDVTQDEITRVYDPGDVVTIEGVIEDLVDSEDVTIRYEDPDGSLEETDNFGEPSSNGIFDSVFEIPNNAEEGIWTVEVDYDNEKAFTYFLVDDVRDTVNVVLDEASGIYQAGDKVTISGDVDNQDAAEEDVVITVLDPTNAELADVDQEPVPLDGDEFTFDFDLENDAPHGRYAVIVEYDVDDQIGFALFEIEDDEDTGGSNSNQGDSADNGQISAEVEAATYEPGDEVEITGEINDLVSGVDVVEYVVEDQDGNEVESNDADVETNGDFTIRFDLANDADEGDYIITITYDDEDDLELEFTVEGSGTSGGGSSSSSLTANLDRTSYLAGQAITVTGTVSRVVSDQDIAIAIYRPDATFAGSIAYVTPKSDKTYTATLTLKSDLAADDGYAVKVNYDGNEATARFAISGVATGSDVLSVKTDKATYGVGSTVIISGNIAAGSSVGGSQVLIQVLTPEDAPCRIDPVDVEADRSYSYSLVTGGQCGLVGEYEVIATFNQKQVKTTFQLLGASGKSAYNLKVEEKVYPIEYDISSGSIKSIFVKPSDKKLVVTIDSPQNGEITLILPREVIDSVQAGSDTGFLVSTTDLETGAGGSADVSESTSANATSRTIVIDYQAGTDLIEISGTTVVPEFGAIAAILFAAAIVGIILATSRSGTRSDLFRLR